jgi:hypothetical protein
MDAVIDYDEAAGFLKNPPWLEPRPNFTNIHALQKHIVQALVQLSCPQSATGGTTPSRGTDISAKVAAVINQLSANQTAIMSQMAAATAQMAALAIVPPPAQNTRANAPCELFYVPPIQQVAVPMQQPFSAAGAYPAGQGGQRGGGGRNQGGCQGGRSRTPFADAMQGAGAAPMMTAMIPYGGGIAQPSPRMRQQRKQLDFSNICKIHNNWNACFSCGFDIKDGHMSITCPFKWWNHQDSFTCGNAQQFIAAGYDPYTKGMHKTVLPAGRNTQRCGAKSHGLANKCKHLVSAYEPALDPTPINNTSSKDDDDVTIIRSNRSHHWPAPQQARPSMAMAARTLFGAQNVPVHFGSKVRHVSQSPVETAQNVTVHFGSKVRHVGQSPVETAQNVPVHFGSKVRHVSQSPVELLP